MVRRRQIGPCSMPGCGTPIYSAYLCEKHDIRRRRHGDPTITKTKRDGLSPCAAPGCDRLTTRKYCEDHEWRFQTYGDPLMAPPRGRRTFQGPCSEPGCGRVATKTGRCERHSRNAETRPMLSVADIASIRLNAGTLPPDKLAGRFNTTPSTVVAVQRGRNWGYLRS